MGNKSLNEIGFLAPNYGFEFSKPSFGSGTAFAIICGFFEADTPLLLIGRAPLENAADTVKFF